MASKVALLSPSLYTNCIPTSVVLYSLTLPNKPIFLTIGTHDERRSTACPPSRGSGLRSKMVILDDGRKRLSQKARVGPAIPDPDIKMLRALVEVDVAMFATS